MGDRWCVGGRAAGCTESRQQVVGPVGPGRHVEEASPLRLSPAALCSNILFRMVPPLSKVYACAKAVLCSDVSVTLHPRHCYAKLPALDEMGHHAYVVWVHHHISGLPWSSGIHQLVSSPSASAVVVCGLQLAGILNEGAHRRPIQTGTTAWQTCWGAAVAGHVSLVIS